MRRRRQSPHALHRKILGRKEALAMSSTTSGPAVSGSSEKPAASATEVRWRRLGWVQAIRMVHEFPEKLRWRMTKEKGGDGKEHFFLVSARGTRWQVRLKHGLQIKRT